jgi:hypothetical protein
VKYLLVSARGFLLWVGGVFHIKSCVSAAIFFSLSLFACRVYNITKAEWKMDVLNDTVNEPAALSESQSLIFPPSFQPLSLYNISTSSDFFSEKLLLAVIYL